MKEIKQEDVLYVATTNGQCDFFEDEEESTEDIMFEWGIEGFGFGTTTFFYRDGVLKCDNEGISPETIKKILCAFVDSAEMVG
jgi:hypothetical protein